MEKLERLLICLMAVFDAIIILRVIFCVICKFGFILLYFIQIMVLVSHLESPAPKPAYISHYALAGYCNERLLMQRAAHIGYTG